MELYHHLTSLAVFAVAAAFTPGPNNVLLMASGHLQKTVCSNLKSGEGKLPELLLKF